MGWIENMTNHVYDYVYMPIHIILYRPHIILSSFTVARIRYMCVVLIAVAYSFRNLRVILIEQSHVASSNAQQNIKMIQS